MKSKMIAIAAAAAVLLAACGGDDSADTDAAPNTTSPANTEEQSDGPSATDVGIEGREISWLLTRPADASVIQLVTEIADEYALDHPGFGLNLITTPDRPSYLQRYETLAVANELPELFDTDATPFTKKLVDQGRLVNIEEFLTDLGLYDQYRPLALDYQRFDDGSLYMLPFEFEMEFFWYNQALFDQVGAELPDSLDGLVDMCAAFRDAGIIPIAVDGQDGWPLERYMAYYPFRLGGPDYINQLKKGEVELSDDIGLRAATWLSDLGSNDCFQEGFSSQGYTDARDLFTSGKAAVYQIGTWELATLTSADLPADVRDNIGYFTLPMVDGAVTDANDYTVVSGIGTAVNADTFDPLVEDFLTYLLNEYPARLAASGHLTPVEGYDVEIPDGASELYTEALAEVNNLGDAVAMPWDTQLDPATNTRLQQELVLLVQGEVSPADFVKLIDDTIADNAPRFFE